MNCQQRDAIQKARLAAVAAMDAGAEESVLIGEIFDAMSDWLVDKLGVPKRSLKRNGGIIDSPPQESISASNRSASANT
jgi:hypothetical protein